MHPVLEYVAMMWDPHKQHLKSRLEMVQWRSACHILHDFSPTSRASAQVAQLQLKNLQSRRPSDKVCMMYKIMNGLVDVNSAASLLKPKTTAPGGINTTSNCPSPLLQNRHVPAVWLWNSVPTGTPSAVTLSVFRFALMGWVEGHTNHNQNQWFF